MAFEITAEGCLSCLHTLGNVDCSGLDEKRKAASYESSVVAFHSFLAF